MNLRARASALVAKILGVPTRLWRIVRHHPWKSVLAVLVVMGGVFFLSRAEAPTVVETEDAVPIVTLARVAELAEAGDSLAVLGEVRSVSQAELRAQKSGKITRVYVQPGTYVTAGTLLAEIDAASERASVLSAQGTLAAAEAQRAKVRAGAQGEDRATAQAQAQGAATSLSASRESARSAYVQAYAFAADAVYAQADDYFTNVYTVRPSFRISSATYDERSALEATRVTLGAQLETWKEKTQTTIPDAELDSALADAQGILDAVANFLNTISGFISEQKVSEYLLAADKAAQEAQIAGARASVSAARSSITGARQGLAAAQSAQVSASLANEKLVTGARSEDIQAVEAAVTQAQGALAGAQAFLENALIRSPISGTVATLNISIGDFVSNFQSIAVVANPSALEVVGFVSASARDRISVGMPALVDGTYNGTVTTLAPGLDPDTKKARFTVGLGDDVRLTNGQSVEIFLNSTSTRAAVREYAVPLSAIKVLPNGLAVFTVREDGTLEARAVTEGAIVGDRMLLTDGVSPELTIVTDVRGLRENERVDIAQ